MTDWATWGQLYYDDGSGYAWHVLPDLVRANPGVQLERGVADDLDIKNGFLSFRLGDPDDLYRPSNAASPLYGQTGPQMKVAFATGGTVRFDGYAQKMAPGQTDDMQESGGTVVKGDRWVDITAGGLLARVGKWRDALDAALITTIRDTYGANLRGYWPMQDGRSATQLANLYQSGKAGTFNNVQLAAAAGPGGSDQVIETSDTSRLTFEYPASISTTGWQYVFACYIPAPDGTLRDVWTWRTSSGHVWIWQVSNTNYQLQVNDSLGASVLTAGSTHGAGAGPGQWINFRIKVSVSGGTVSIDPDWYPEASGVLYGFSTSYSGAAGRPVNGGMTGNVITDGARYGHHFVLTGTTDNLDAGAFTSAFNGYAGELTIDRFARLCTARGLGYLVRGDSTTTMGAQPIDTVLTNLKEIRTTERGLMFDRGDFRGIVLATYEYLYEQAADPVLDLTWPDDIAPPLLEDPDTDQVFNYVTAENSNGSSSTAELAAGRLGTADPPTGAGRIDKTVSVNLNDDADLDLHANWWMRYFTQGTTRFATVVIDIDAQPGLETACETAEPGMFMRITGRTPDPLLLMILSTAENTHRKRRIFTFSVAPAKIFRTGTYGDGSRYQGNHTTADEALDSTETGWDIASVEPSKGWTSNTPYDWLCEGERVTVTSITAPAFSSGAWRQTATVTRSVNGVVKSHNSGAVIKLADPIHWK